MADYTRVIELKPRARYFLFRSHSHRAFGRWDETNADLSREVGLEPTAAMLHTKRGEALRMSGRHDEALAHFDRAIGLTPVGPSSLTNRGVTYRLLGHIDEAQAGSTGARARTSAFPRSTPAPPTRVRVTHTVSRPWESRPSSTTCCPPGPMPRTTSPRSRTPT
ncbi:tetratricopeptide repeat protein [Streptomyces bauhiniae]|uniref:tetratricopeptide repeat protein n=1 Tax=Streptomyces bauhiniae TaxID=2340725 RepID=UPI003D27E22D